MLKFTKQIILTVTLVLFLGVTGSFASTTVSIGNIDLIPGTYDTGIGSLNLYFTASTNTTIAGTGFQTSWFGFTAEGSGTTSLRWNAGDLTATSFPLQDGTIATLTFTGATGLVLSDWEFFDYNLDEITEVQLATNTMSGTGDGAIHFNVVPIPGAIWLLGSGLLGLVGLNRRRRS